MGFKGAQWSSKRPQGNSRKVQAGLKEAQMGSSGLKEVQRGSMGLHWT